MLALDIILRSFRDIFDAPNNTGETEKIDFVNECDIKQLNKMSRVKKRTGMR